MADLGSEEKSVHEGTSDIELANEAFRIAERGQASADILTSRQVEMTRRLVVALRVFNASSDRWSRRLFWATWVLLAATLAIVVLTLVLVLKP